MNATIRCDSNGSWPYLGANNDDLPTNDNGSRLLRLSHECKPFIMNSIYHYSNNIIDILGTHLRDLLKEWTTYEQRIVVFVVELAFRLNLIIDFWPSHVLFHQNVNKNYFFANQQTPRNHI